MFGKLMQATTPNMMGGMGANPMANIMNTIQQIQKIRQNPNQLGDLLLQNGKITQQQYEEISRMNGNPQQIGQYLMQSGTMTQQQVQEAYQNAVPQIQNAINNTH